MSKRTFKSARAEFVAPDNHPYRYRDGSLLDTSPGYHPHISTRFRNWDEKIAPAMSARELPELYRNRFECCGCTACEAVCPKDAISMEFDEEGYLYPVVDAALCIRCKKCEQVCVFKEALVERWSTSESESE